MATIVAVAPVWSRKIRAIALRSDRTKAGGVFITSGCCSENGSSVDGRHFFRHRTSVA